MTVRNVLRHDLTVVRRTVVGKLLFALSLGGTFAGILAGYVVSNGPLTGDYLVSALWLVTGTVLPLGVLSTTAVAISADRESGRLRLLFGTPVTKSDVFLGTLLSRIAAVSLSVIVGFLVTRLIVSVVAIDVASGTFWRFAAFTVLTCVAYTSVGTAVSAVSSTRLRAVGVAIGFFVWSVFWPQLVSEIAGPGGPQLGEPTAAETLAHFVGTLSPFGAYSQVVTSSQAIYGESVSGPLLATPTMTLILVAWTVFPPLAGRWWFSRIDL